jgi:hypothetical protein
LNEKFKIIDYSLKGKNDSRKHFVEALIGKKIDLQGINKFFEPYSHKLKGNYSTDNVFIKIDEELKKTIK